MIVLPLYRFRACGYCMVMDMVYSLFYENRYYNVSRARAGNHLHDLSRGESELQLRYLS